MARKDMSTNKCLSPKHAAGGKMIVSNVKSQAAEDSVSKGVLVNSHPVTREIHIQLHNCKLSLLYYIDSLLVGLRLVDFVVSSPQSLS